ncbi:unnamed protein product [Effrenium voratum]|nr:unnamed protein product [Effrenium voratum]
MSGFQSLLLRKYSKVLRRRYAQAANALNGTVPWRGVVDFVEQGLKSRGRTPLTLTYAQSLDGSIAAHTGRVLISGQASMTMTHQLRTMHDALLIGSGTLLADNPKLTARLVPGRSPLPVVLDSRLRTPPTCGLVAARESGDGDGDGRLPRLVIVTTRGGPADKWARAKALDRLGVHILEVPEELGRCSLEDTLLQLQAMGCNSVMVEGGMAVIASFLARPELVSNVVVTVSPKFLGGLGPCSELAARGSSDLLSMDQMSSCAVGSDIVIYGAAASSPVQPVNGHVNGVNGVNGVPWESIGMPRTVDLRSSCRMWIEAVESECDFKVYGTAKEGQEIVALIKGNVEGADDVPVRVHSECFTGDVLGSKRCDCGPQLRSFLDILQEEPRGVLLYIRGVSHQSLASGRAKFLCPAFHSSYLMPLQETRAGALASWTRSVPMSCRRRGWTLWMLTCPWAWQQTCAPSTPPRRC